MKIYDLSIPIKPSMVVWEDDPKASIETFATVSKDEVKMSQLSFTTHTGTHIDAPSHFLENGGDLESIPLEKFIGPCRVVDLQTITGTQVNVSDLEQFDIQKGERILLKTGNFKLLKQSEFVSDYISVSLEAAEYLAQKEINLVGIDYLGIEAKSAPGHPVHKALLTAGIVIVEGLDLSQVPEGEYQLYCLPLNVVGVDGCPCRAILVEN